MTERASFLKTIRAALGVAADTERSVEAFPALLSGPDHHPVLADITNRSADDRRLLLQRFQENAAEIRLQVHCAADYSAAADIIVDIARNAEPEFSTDRRIIRHGGRELASLKLEERLAGEAITVHTLAADDKEAREKTIRSYIGITAADWGIAESATVVQLTEPGKSRSTSLVPSVHIALLPIERLLADLYELRALLQDRPPTSSYVLISGPSKTGDIESHIVFGAHGPRDMHVVVLTGEDNDGRH